MNPPVSINVVDSIMNDHRQMEELYNRFSALAKKGAGLTDQRYCCVRILAFDV